MILASATEIPRQKLNASEKTEEWAQKTVNAYISLSRFNRSFTGNTFIENLYRFYNGEVEDEDYTHVTNPFGNKRKHFPAKIHNYNIIKPTVDRLLGEKAQRGLLYSVVNTSPDAVTAKKAAKKQFVQQLAKDYFLQQLAEAGIPVDEETPPLPEFEFLDEKFDNDYVDSKAIMGQNALNFLTQDLEMEDQFIEGFKHYLISGTVVSHRGVNHDKVHWKIVNPLDVDGDKDPDIEFFEDGDWVAYRKLSFPSSVIDYYYDDLTPDQIERLERPRGQYSSDFITRTGASDSAFIDHDQSYQRRDRTIEVIITYWKTRKKVGFVTYEDEFGFIQEKIVEEGYEPGFDEDIRWEWVNEVWEGHRIDGDIFVRLRPYPDQRWAMDNPSECKLPINGHKYADTNSAAISLVMLGVPYQISYNIYKYRLELAIAKSKDRVAQFDINMIPKKWKPEDFLYWVESTGIAWVDYNKEDIKLSPQHQAVMDLTIQTIDKYIQLLQQVILEWERISGINAERAGIISPYQGKGVTEQAIFQGSLVTEDIFRKFKRFEKRELQAILDYSKRAWRDGKRTQYLMSDGEQAILDIDGVDFQESEYGVFVTNSAEDLQNIQILKENAQAMIQNGTPLSIVSNLIKSKSFEDIQKKIEEIEKLEAQQAEAIREAELAEAEKQRMHEQNLEDREDQRQREKIEADIAISQMDNQTKKEVAAINQSQRDSSD